MENNFELLTINEYMDFLEEKELENNSNSIDLFISAIYYDVLDDIQERTPLVLNKIERILKKHFSGVLQ